MQSECFDCNNCHLIATIYEEALRRGYDADYQPNGDGGTWFVEVFCITRWDLEQMVAAVRGGRQLPLALA